MDIFSAILLVMSQHPEYTAGLVIVTSAFWIGLFTVSHCIKATKSIRKAAKAKPDEVDPPKTSRPLWGNPDSERIRRILVG